MLIETVLGNPYDYNGLTSVGCDNCKLMYIAQLCHQYRSNQYRKHERGATGADILVPGMKIGLAYNVTKEYKTLLSPVDSSSSFACYHSHACNFTYNTNSTTYYTHTTLHAISSTAALQPLTNTLYIDVQTDSLHDKHK